MRSVSFQFAEFHLPVGSRLGIWLGSALGLSLGSGIGLCIEIGLVLKFDVLIDEYDELDVQTAARLMGAWLCTLRLQSHRNSAS